MKIEQVHTLVLGAGPSGLAAAYSLAKAGAKPVVLERDKVCGGLMRSIKHGDFILDIGRKELYNRLAKVDAFWQEILGNDYRTYPHRGGILWNGNIIDMSAAYKGVLRGMPLSLFLGCGLDLLWWRVKPGLPKARTLEDYWYRQRGRLLTRVANQGFQEKLNGRKWIDVTLPEQYSNGRDESFLKTVSQAVARGVSKKEPNTFKGIWRHPAKGTGQICSALEAGVLSNGGRICFQTRITGMSASAGRVTDVTAEVGAESVNFKPQFVVSSAPAEFLCSFLLPDRPEGKAVKKGAAPARTVILVYLFMDEEPLFPHFWLQVTDPSTKIGRIANYSALNSDMVPKGKSCLCCEIYCYGADPLLETPDKEVAEIALQDCARQNLLHPEKCFDKLVLKFPGADASQNRHNWLNQGRQKLLVELRQFQNLYSVNRTDLDIATQAGLDAAEAILSGDRSAFDKRIDPEELSIRSEPKPFEFRNPPGVQI